MQPPPPSTPPPPAPPPAPGVPPGRGPGRTPNRRLRLFLALGLGIVVILCLGGIGVAVSLYDDATEIDRGSPEVVTENFLRAYLVNRDNQEADLLKCDSADLSQLDTFLRDLEAVEQEYSLGVRVTWTAFVVTTDGDTATINTELVRTLSDNSERDAKRWTFTVVDQGGWRVCGGAPLV